MKTFRGMWQSRDWQYDEKHLLGPPGGFGAVYAGFDDKGTAVAVKKVGLQGPAGGTITERLRNREAEIAEKLQGRSSDHLMVVQDVGMDGDDLLLVMERAEESLHDHLGGSALSSNDTKPILRNIASGLTELHEAGVIHRDLKPKNVLRVQGVWRLTDFGIAHDEDLGTQTETFKGYGTLPYMAPELFDRRSASVKSDLYALGCLTYELLTGKPPFVRGGADDYAEAHRKDAVPPLPEGTDPPLETLVIRLLAKDPARRPQDGSAVLEQLERVRPASDELDTRLREGQAARERAASDREARVAEQAAAIDRRREKANQAASDLLALVDDTERNLRDNLAELTREDVAPTLGDRLGPWGHGNNPRAIRLATAAAQLEIRIWRDLPKGFREHDPAIVGGEVVARHEGLPPDEWQLLANVVVEGEADRLVWKLYRFRLAGVVPPDYYPYPTDREHGLEPQHFAEGRQIMLKGGTHIWKHEIVRLQPEALQALFAEAQELEPLWRKS